MADMMTALRGILGEGADDKIKAAMNMLSQGTQNSENKAAPSLESIAEAVNNDIKTEPTRAADGGALQMLTPEGLQFVGQIKSMLDKASNTDDSRSELLRSLRPFMRSERQRSIDRVIRVINIGRLSGLFGR